MTKNRLETIATRQRNSFVRDVAFVALVAIATIVGITSVATAANAANTTRPAVACDADLQIAQR
jgi:hypothetical protein